jgi:calcium-dependent protein kinase
MGCTSSKTNYLQDVSGGEEDFHKRYFEDAVLGEGEFGVVKLIHDMRPQAQDGHTTTTTPYAVKILKKGVSIKDNVLYSPLKPEILKRECDILMTLQGKHYCLLLHEMYESSRCIYLVTEFCAGGEMMKYVSIQQEELTTKDVSRIAFQLLDAIHHCASHSIIHRDVKPENCMFVTSHAGSPLRLIDFGSGAMDNVTTQEKKDTTSLIHTTFCGSAFYISPELFQRTYTSKTDVWSVGVVLYVLVAGYPAEELQTAFNLLHKSSSHRNLHNLPNLNNDMPESYFELLEELLQYRHKMRKSAGQLLQQEFVLFHKQHDNDDDYLNLTQVVNDSKNNVNNTSTSTSTSPRRSSTKSMVLTGSVKRHSLFLDYVTFERSVTTLIATLVPKEEFQLLLIALKSKSSKLNIIPMVELMETLKERKQSQWYARDGVIVFV